MSQINTLVKPLYQLVSGNKDNSIVFMDTAVENYQSLITGVVAGIEVIILNCKQDGVEQISQVLAQRQGISSIHIVSHGNCGSVQLGTASLNVNTLFYYASQLQNWSHALTKTAQILLYGCNVAAGTQGKVFVEKLSELTNTIVAASKDLTGSASLGGNWNLEVQTGSGVLELAFSSATMKAYESVLTAPYLVKDINPGLASSSISNPLNVDGTLYFTANDGIYGNQLWRVDNTTGDAVRITDINSGSGSSFLNELTNVNGTLYFRANDGISGYELWRIDNTTGKAVRVTDINSGSWFSSPNNWTNVNGTLYFTASHNTNGNELWRIDNTTGNAVQVADINPGFDSSFPNNLINVDGTLYFRANDGSNRADLWRIDNTTGNPVLIEGASNADFLTNVNGILYFTVYESNIYRLYRIDNTTGNAVEVAGIDARLENPFISNLRNFNNTLYFRVTDDTTSDEWYRIDNTTGNAVQLTAMNLGSGYSNPYILDDVNGTVYFYIYNNTNGAEFWRIDDTTGSAVRVTGSYPGSMFSNPGNSLTNIDGILYFTASDNNHGYELWRIDNVTGNAVRVTDINPGSGNSFPHNLVHVNGKLYFTADDGINGQELWALSISDILANRTPFAANDSFNTDQNTPVIISTAALLANDADLDGDNLVVTAATQPKQGNLVNNNDGTYTYTPAEDYYGVDRFTYTISDGQGNTSTAIVNLTVNQFPAVSKQPYSLTATNSILKYANSSNLTIINDVLYFTADNDSGRTLLLSIDSTTGKVFQTASFNLVGYSQPENLTNANGTFYFTAYGIYGQGYGLWRIDNNTGNAVEITNINQNYEFLDISYLTNVNDTLYFVVNNNYTGESKLWKIDNNTDDAVTVTGINLNPSNLINVNGTLYFVAYEGIDGRELWTIDNNTGNAVRVTLINSVSISANPSSLINVNDTLYFVANNGISGDELWKVDNAGNAVLVRDINPGSGSSNLYNLTNVNGTLYFTANDGSNGIELWKIDNTGNAVLVRDINPGAGDSNPSHLINGDGTLYFIANDGSNGTELWQVDNNTGKPVRITDINPGSGNSYPDDLAYVDGILYFTYVNPDNYINNRELWALPVSNLTNYNPIVGDDTIITATNTPVIISVATLLGNDADADGDVLSVTSLSQPGHGTLVNNNDGTYTYTPDNGYYGLDSLTYTVSDGNGGISTATVNLNISAPYPVRGIYLQSPFDDGVSDLFSFNDTLYFFAARQGSYPFGGTSAELWTIDSNTNEAVALSPSEEIPDRSYDSPIILNNRPYIITRGRFSYDVSIRQVDISTGQPIEPYIYGVRFDEDTPPKNINGTIYFTSFNFGDFSTTLWKIDENTGEFVLLVTANQEFPSFSYIGEYDEIDGISYYVIETATYEVDEEGNQTGVVYTSSLWNIDSTTGNPVQIIEISSALDYPSISNLTDVDGILYFTANNDNFGRELWKIDHTDDPVRLRDINPSFADLSPENLTNINGTLYFIANDGITGNELWKIDPTNNPVRLTDINPGSGDSLVSQLFIFNDTLYFTANDGSTGTELWEIDSNTGNAVLVSDINPGIGSANPRDFNNIDDTLYFIANDGSSNDVWKIDASTSNVVRLRDIFAEYEFTSIGMPVDINGRLYFTASNPTYGNELWTIDESTGSLIVLTDIVNPGAESSNPRELTFADDTLYFLANSNIGYQLWALPVSNIQVINGTDNADNLVGTDQNEVINGGDGNDFVDGGGGNDTIVGGRGDGDRLFGGDGNDVITDPDGIFAAHGGLGNDTITITFAPSWDNNTNPNDAPRSDGKITGGYGDDIITVTMNNPRFFINLKGDEPISNDPRDGNDVITLLGNYANSVVDLGGGDDTFNGGVGADNVSGGDGNDILQGGDGNDRLNGGQGDDILIGGQGKDILIGGAGKDSFHLSLPLVGDFDTINDFNVLDDTIFISTSEFGLSEHWGVQLDSQLFRLGASATTASDGLRPAGGDRFIYDQSTGNLFFDADGLGGTAQIKIAHLSNQAALSNTHISLL
ncbi:DUF4347 domain-containing protein [Anabaena subtropica]|uniref:DUF4347 domain-containing protein n=1 Tax=Anabaena subtropica FACHB-260 TaxID=2692884 RepID=A0ABR8CM55_9NOST|nr:DUF4347 domain-containing protein [Anabaena subtropica]MBD2344302.1 DUF4347 domain-containing protein [Anabaena subtropica FACHB-260]